MKKRGFPLCVSLSRKNTKSFLRKTRTLLFLLEQNVTKNTHAKEDVFHFDSLRFADDGFCAQKDRRELARVQVRVTVRMMSLFTRNFVSFFSFFLISFLPSSGVSGTGKTKRFGCGPSLSPWGVHRYWGSIGPITKDESGRKTNDGGGGLCCCCCLVGRTLLLVVVSKEVVC